MQNPLTPIVIYINAQISSYQEAIRSFTEHLQTWQSYPFDQQHKQTQIDFLQNSIDEAQKAIDDLVKVRDFSEQIQSKEEKVIESYFSQN